jgi:hypothetical protein
MSTNAVWRKYSSHIDMGRHYVRELCVRRVVKLIPLRTQAMLADALTKSFPAPMLARQPSVMVGHPVFRSRI